MEKLLTGLSRLGFKLTSDQLRAFETYYRELISWNKKVNLTAITKYEDVQTKHFLDSLTISPYIGVSEDPPHIIDIGSGAGFPGIPLKIMFPKISLVLIDSIGKKTRFLQYIINILGLTNAAVITGRAEELAHNALYREHFDMAISRAVGSFATVIELMLPFCSLGGVSIIQKKGDIREELNNGQKALNILGGRLTEIKTINLEEIGEERLLVVVEKVVNTPEMYPRRAGIPTRRPLL